MAAGSTVLRKLFNGSGVTQIAGILLIIFLIYAFQGLISFAPYMMGFVFKIVFYPIEIINQIIYPVGNIVYIFAYGAIAYFVFHYVITLFKKSG